MRLFCDEYIKYVIDCKLEERRRPMDVLPPDGWATGTAQAGPFGPDLFAQPFGMNGMFYEDTFIC
jgi:hypothetical protein